MSDFRRVQKLSVAAFKTEHPILIFKLSRHIALCLRIIHTRATSAKTFFTFGSPRIVIFLSADGDVVG
ncbi:MAG: hypothetical protein H7Z37_04345 [Pyrinomonadaceae bacterium]|nr:hypothetical protein [Pyrinomonadaceae bacterium]